MSDLDSFLKSRKTKKKKGSSKTKTNYSSSLTQTNPVASKNSHAAQKLSGVSFSKLSRSAKGGSTEKEILAKSTSAIADDEWHDSDSEEDKPKRNKAFIGKSIGDLPKGNKGMKSSKIVMNNEKNGNEGESHGSKTVSEFNWQELSEKIAAEESKDVNESMNGEDEKEGSEAIKTEEAMKDEEGEGEKEGEEAANVSDAQAAKVRYVPPQLRSSDSSRPGASQFSSYKISNRISGERALKNLDSAEVFPTLGESIAKLKVNESQRPLPTPSSSSKQNSSRFKQSIQEDKKPSNAKEEEPTKDTPSSTPAPTSTPTPVETAAASTSASSTASKVPPKVTKSKSEKFAKLAELKKKKAAMKKMKSAKLQE